MNFDRRELLKGALLAAAAAALTSTPTRAAIAPDEDFCWDFVDTNVSLFQWPFRRLAGDTSDEMVRKLQRHHVRQAWAGSFEGLLHRDVDGVNSRLVEACRQAPDHLLLPFGTVNLALPDWEEDLRRCHEVHQMPGIRLHPNYHGYTLDDPRFERLMALAAERGLLVQLAVSLEDPRTQHPMLQVADVDLSPLPALLKKTPQTKLILLNQKLRGELLKQLAAAPQVSFDIARVEATDGIAQLARVVPVERIAFGSHAPFLIFESAMIKVGESQLNDQQCGLILGANARKLLPSDSGKTQNAIDVKQNAGTRNAAHGFGLPPAEQLQRFEIWDSYFTPADNRLVEDLRSSLPTVDMAGIQKLCLFLHVGLGTLDPRADQRVRERPEQILQPLEQWPQRLLGFIQLNANDIDGSLNALDRYMRDGPIVGVYFPGGRWGSLNCRHPNYIPLVQRISELGGVIMQHTWYKTGAVDEPGLSTPADLTELAAQFPDQQFIAAHAGGEWEKGISAVRGTPNVLVETSGFDPTSGFIDVAVRELGAERIIFGSHLPSRSLGTELGKVLGASITDEQRHLILGENLRRLLQPILARKGLI